MELDRRTLMFGSMAAMVAITPGDGTTARVTEEMVAGDFAFSNADLSAEVAKDTRQALFRAPVSDPTGASGAWVRQYYDEIYLSWFNPVGDGVADDTAALQAFAAILNSDSQLVGKLGIGVFAFNQTINLSLKERAIIGTRGGYRTGSTNLGTTLKWTGGANPMFSTSTTRHYFIDIGVDGNGSATDFLEMNTGAQAVYMDRVFFKNALFTRSVIRSNGNLIGYSRFYRVNATKSAPKFLDIDGMGTGNGCTPISFVECQFAGTDFGSIDPWTVVHLKDELIEAVVFERCTLISRDGLIVVDTTESPLAATIDILNIHNCEIDNVEGTSTRMFKLTNVGNVNVNSSMFFGNGEPEYIFDCVNTSVTSFTGNYWKSITYIFDLDNTSRISGVGRNNPDWSATQGIHDNPDASRLVLTKASAVTIDGTSFAPAEVGYAVIDIDSTGGYDFRIDTSKPQNMESGQKFDLTIRNTSGGAVSNGTFNSSSFKANSPVAPADGFSRTYSFRFDGTHAVEIGRTYTDVPN